MFSTIWQLLTTSWGKAILPVIRFLLTTGRDMLKVYGVFNSAYSTAEHYLPPSVLAAELEREGFEIIDNCKRMKARKLIVIGLAQYPDIKIKDLYLDILNSVFYFIKKYRVTI